MLLIVMDALLRDAQFLYQCKIKMLLFSSVKFSSHLILNIMYLKLFFFSSSLVVFVVAAVLRRQLYPFYLQ